MPSRMTELMQRGAVPIDRLEIGLRRRCRRCGDRARSDHRASVSGKTRNRARLAPRAETIFDAITNIRGGVREHLMGAAGGTTWLILVFYVPAVVASVVLLIWQLFMRSGEMLDPAIDGKPRQRQVAVLTTS